MQATEPLRDLGSLAERWAEEAGLTDGTTSS